MAAPVNDNCTSPTNITLTAMAIVGSYSGTAIGSNVGATPDTYNSNCFNANQNVWYTFTAPVAGSYFVGVVPGTMQGPEVSISIGNCTAATEYACAGDQGDSYTSATWPYPPLLGYSPNCFWGGDVGSSIYSYAGICSITAGQKIQIMVDNSTLGAPGTFSVIVGHLKNDDLSAPLLINNCGTVFQSSTIGATNCGNGIGDGYYNNLDNAATACNNSATAKSCGNGSGAPGGACYSAGTTGANYRGGDVGYSVENDSWYEFCVTSSATVTLTFSVNAASCLSTGTSALQISVFTGTPTNFTKVGGGYCGQSISGSTSFTYPMTPSQCCFVEVDGFGGTNCNYSIQTSLTPACVLPVEMLYFNGTLTDDISAKLSWATATEQNADYYLIEKSSDGINYTALSRTKAVGNSTTLSNYVTYDKTPAKGLNYYKLTEFDKNGAPSFFGYATVSNNAALELFNVYPNPAQNALTLSLKNFAVPVVGYELYDAQGKLVQKENISLSAGDALYNLDLSSFEKGLYFVKLVGTEAVLHKTFIKQ
ncbi:MAG: T9SS type A sorting domain-containing protein [Bacteroidetes bacterium]|nr:T9SS type A sorting domain-containing protein [Bacteroidota bacterium]